MLTLRQPRRVLRPVIVVYCVPSCHQIVGVLPAINDHTSYQQSVRRAPDLQVVSDAYCLGMGQIDDHGEVWHLRPYSAYYQRQGVFDVDKLDDSGEKWGVVLAQGCNQILVGFSLEGSRIAQLH